MGDSLCYSLSSPNYMYTIKCIHVYYMDTSVLLKNTPLVKFMRNYIRDSSSIFSIFSENVRQHSCDLRTSSGIKVVGNVRKIVKNAFIGMSI